MNEQRRAEREARGWRELADAIEQAWRSRFGAPSVVAEVELSKMRREGR